MSARRERWTVTALLLASALLYAWFLFTLLPDARGRVGNDYAYFLPRLLAGAYWYEQNGPFDVPWFTPAFAGGLPFYAHPAIGWFSLPQALAVVAGPLSAVRWTQVVMATVGAWATYRLLRGPFACGRWAALLGATLFQWNSFLVARFLVGHLTFHAAGLVPLAAWALLARRRRRGGWLDDALAGVLPGALLAYAFQCGDFYGIPPAGLAIAALAALDHVRNGRNPGLALRSASGLLLALLLCAAKLCAGAAFTGNFPRADYPLPGFDGLGWALVALVRCCFLVAPVDGPDAHLVNRRFTHQQVEFEFGTSVVPLLLLAAVVFTVRADRAWLRRHALALGVLVAALALPLAVNVFEPHWNAWLKSVPGVRSASSLTRWFVAYVPLACVAAGACFERVVRAPRLKPALAVLLGALAVAQRARVDAPRLIARGYDPGPVEAGSLALRHGGGVVPIRRVDGPAPRPGGGDPLLDERLVEGVSQIQTFDPAFGYGYERYPRGALHPGDPFELTDGGFNFKHPAAYVFPREQGRAPGDPFRVSERDALAAFLEYRPFPYAAPPLFRAACAASRLAACALPLLALAALARRRRRGGPAAR